MDLGTYRVFAENVAGHCETSCKLFIQEVPNIDETAYVNPDSFKPFEYIPRPHLSYDSEDGEKQPVLIVKPLEDQECFEDKNISKENLRVFCGKA